MPNHPYGLPEFIELQSDTTLSYGGPRKHHTFDESVEHLNVPQSPEVIEKPHDVFFPPGTGYGSDTLWGRRKLVWWKAVTFAGVVIALTGGILIGFLNRVPNLGLNDGDPADIDPNSRTIVLDSTLVSVDPIVGTMTLDFAIVNDTSCFYDSDDVQSKANCTDVDLFFDQNLLTSTGDPSGPPPSNNFPSAPIFHWNATANFQRQALIDVRPNSPVFRLNIALFGHSHSPHNLQSYPFDVYDTFLFMFAQETATNNTVSVAIGSTSGVAVGFTGSLNSASSGSPFISEIVTLRRSVMIKAYTMIILIAIWGITLILVVATITPLVFGYQQRVEVLVIPVGTLFAFTQLRATLPGAPAGFGATIDFVGILPCLALMSLSGAMCLAALVLSDPTANRETHATRLIKKVSKLD